MNDAKSRFFASMEREMEEDNQNNLSERFSSKRDGGLDIEFSVTESGRTVAYMVTDTNRSLDMDFSVTESGRSNGDMSYMGLTESDRDELLKAFGPESSSSSTLDNNLPETSVALSKPPSLPPVNELRQVAARSIPVPKLSNQQQAALIQQQPQHQSSSQASSYESSGSTFLSSVLNPNPGTFPPVLYPSHTPPTASSYEVSHFGKRARAGSVSGKLRSASDYLEEKGLFDRETKGILNDLLIMGDEEMQYALDRYDAGDPSVLEQMIRSGSLQNRLPKDIDILGGLGDFDFLTVHEQMGDTDPGGPEAKEDASLTGHVTQRQYQVNEPRSTQQQQQKYSGAEISRKILPDLRSKPIPMQQQPTTMVNGTQGNVVDGRALGHSSAIVPPQHPYDDGIGDLDFAGDFVSDQVHFNMNFNQPQSFGSVQANPSAVSSPVEGMQLTEHERRNRSNSLFSALLNNEQRAGSLQSHASHATHNTFGRHLVEWNSEETDTKGLLSTKKQGIKVGGRLPPTSPNTSGIATSLEAERKRKEVEDQKRKKLDKASRQQERKGKKERKQLEKSKAVDEEENEEHVPGCGRPRSLSDPNLKVTVDKATGLMEVERPDGWIGAYSPESRKIRLDRFMEKRKHRVWQQTVKYDVRKNFANSRLRVKGRFVKKEDELIMRELMSLT